MPEIGNGVDVLSAQAVYAIIWSLTSFAIAVTLLRLYTRAFVVKALGLDDALILFGLVCIAVLPLFCIFDGDLLTGEI